MGIEKLFSQIVKFNIDFLKRQLLQNILDSISANSATSASSATW